MPNSCALLPRPCYSYPGQERNSQTPRFSDSLDSRILQILRRFIEAEESYRGGGPTFQIHLDSSKVSFNGFIWMDLLTYSSMGYGRDQLPRSADPGSDQLPRSAHPGSDYLPRSADPGSDQLPDLLILAAISCPDLVLAAITCPYLVILTYNQHQIDIHQHKQT